MEKTCPSCYSCGMPLKTPADFALGDIHQKYCSHCTNEKGQLKPFSEVVKGMAGYLAHSQGLAMDAASQLAENLLSKQPAWRKE